MDDSFDPYLKWLGIRSPERPPNHYALLGLSLFEDDPEVVSNAADRQMSHVRTFQVGPHSHWSQRLLNELAAAKLCLLKAERKAAYDANLGEQLAAAEAAAAATAAASAAETSAVVEPSEIPPVVDVTPTSAEFVAVPEYGAEHGDAAYYADAEDNPTYAGEANAPPIAGPPVVAPSPTPIGEPPLAAPPPDAFDFARRSAPMSFGPPSVNEPTVPPPAGLVDHVAGNGFPAQAAVYGAAPAQAQPPATAGPPELPHVAVFNSARPTTTAARVRLQRRRSSPLGIYVFLAGLLLVAVVLGKVVSNQREAFEREDAARRAAASAQREAAAAAAAKPKRRVVRERPAPSVNAHRPRSSAPDDRVPLRQRTPGEAGAPASYVDPLLQEAEGPPGAP
ncbi:MAG: hypothetical protein AB7U73_11835 [Pirellulales bacterium]